MRHIKTTLAAGALILILFLQLFLSARRNSITWDEDDHIYAGYMSWKHGDFGLNPEHPPLVKLVASLPLLNMTLKMPDLQDRFFKHEAFLGGKDFMFKNDANTMLVRARMAASIFTLILVILVFLATEEMFGNTAAFIALALLAFDPNLIAHGAVVGTDAGLSCFMFASVYAFYRYAKRPSMSRLLAVGIAAGLALASKHTGILVFPILFMLAICEIVSAQSSSYPADVQATTAKKAKQFAVALIAISTIAIGILWSAYGFRYQARPDGRQMNPPFANFLQGLSRPREARLLQSVAHFHLLPESYLYGLADVRIMSDFYTSFLLGKIYPHGVWFYFPVAFAIKSSVSFLILLLIAIWAIATRRLRRWREILFLTIPPAFYLMIAMMSGMNIGVRHILPMYLFLSVLVAGVAGKLIAQNRRWAYPVLVLLIFQAISTVRTYPAYLAYANELWGGPSQTYKLLSDSNVDWGQQLKDVKRYLDEHGIQDCWFIYFGEGVIDASYYGIPCKPLPTADSLWVDEPANAPPAIDGTVLISAGDLSGFEFGPGELNPYEQFKTAHPTAVIDYGVFFYNGHFEIPLAASIGHSQKAQWLLDEHHIDAALLEAQKALSLAPNAVKPNSLMGDVLAADGHPDEARGYYQKALTLAKNVEPDFQVGSVSGLEKKLATQDH
ncbi:MAG TPA: glycosyltransferase family 39 protein [Candidatus Aquilonibacter sp.]|jgi:4-amino-4-deoxy-L-arabinose transferase-like glycosyltransferase|nr:glycosyltransferase family 39 protein [Candidatus Aquilonibacter sp.]